MVKKAIFFIIAVMLIVTCATPVFCDEPSAKVNGPLTKLGRGLSNMVTFPLEVPEQISRTNNSDGPFAGWTVGLLKGFGSAVARATVGIFETATFMFPGSKNYEPVLKDPEYFLENSNF